MIVAFLKFKEITTSLPSWQALEGFLNFYAKEFNYKVLRIDISSESIIVDKKSDALVEIASPLDPDCNLTPNCGLFPSILDLWIKLLELCFRRKRRDIEIDHQTACENYFSIEAFHDIDNP